MGIRKIAGLLLILAIYAVLVIGYDYVIPFSKGPDEYINFQYIRFIAGHKRLPATVAERQEAGVKADWQPLYHMLGGLLASPIPLETSPELKVTWEPATRQLIDIVLPRATLVRTEDERLPVQGAYAVWQVGRWLSMLLGAGTLLFTYLISLSIWPRQPALAVGVAALLGFMPRYLFTHAVLSDDTLLGFWLALYLLLLVRLIKRSDKLEAGMPGRGPGPAVYFLFAGMGITIGLAIVTKFAAIPAVFGATIAGILIVRRHRWGWLTMLKLGSTFFVTLGAAVGWWIAWVWWHFNQIHRLGWVAGLMRPLLPGAAVDDNPTTARLTALLSGQPPAALGEAPGAGGTFLDWVHHSFITLWGVTVFGADPVWPYPYAFILAGVALFCIAASAGFFRVYRHSASSERIIWQAFFLHLVLFFPIPLLRFAVSRRLNDAAQGRHLLFPAGPAIIIILMAGWLIWFRPQWRNRAALILGGLMLAWGVGHGLYLWSAYPEPLPVRTTSGPQIELEQSIRANFEDIVQLTAYQIEVADPVSILQLELLWLSLSQAWEDYQTEVILVDQQGQTRLRWLSQPADGRFPMRAWQPGDVVRDTLHIPIEGLAAGTYEVRLRLLGWDNALVSDIGEQVNLTIITLDHPAELAKPALWQQGSRVPERSEATDAAAQATTYRYRSTIPVTAAPSVALALIDPNDGPRLPVSEQGPLRIFTVDHSWPSGVYRLRVDGADGGLGLQIENFDRRRHGAWSFSPPTMTHDVRANFDDKIQLLGYDLPLRRVEAGAGIPLVLYWQGLSQMRQDFTMFVQLLDAKLERRGGYDRYPRETYNTYLWVPQEVVDDGFAVPVDADAPDGIYTIRIGWYLQDDRKQVVMLPLVHDGLISNENSVVLGPIKVGSAPPDLIAAAISADVPLNVELGDSIRLKGYDFAQEVGAIDLTLYWQSLAPTDIDYTVFIHLRDESGQIMAQSDGPPVQGRYPTSLWDRDDRIADTHRLRLPPEILPGSYQLLVGLYDPRHGTRLAVPDSADDTIFLREIRVE